MASAMTTKQRTRSTAAPGRAEHISLESADDLLAPLARQPRRKVRSSYKLRSPVRGYETEVAILDEHYVAVRSVRPHVQPTQYELDLRFVNARPVRVRRIAWFWLSLTAGFALLGAAALWSLWPVAGENWRNPILLTALVTMAASLAAAFMFIRRTTESLEFVSVHGGITLVGVTGGIGSARAGRRFFVELIKNINAAKAARQQQRAQFLRDEMREHSRLRDLGAISAEQYEASKARILGAH
jgi:hypothetical protein